MSNVSTTRKSFATMMLLSVACEAVALYDDYREPSSLEELVKFAAPFLFVGVICGRIWTRGKRRLAGWLFLIGQGALLALYLVFERAMRNPKTGATAAILLSAARLFYSVPIVIAVAVVWLVVG